MQERSLFHPPQQHFYSQLLARIGSLAVCIKLTATFLAPPIFVLELAGGGFEDRMGRVMS
jgi:hypothetical protein